ncbi:hypothetical protein LY78DRAFT_293876 [Colletotrichum sublineola]|nr:hypothetical protein LY78DRAFT_293876 [Colletotrichum sublineola]
MCNRMALSRPIKHLGWQPNQVARIEELELMPLRRSSLSPSSVSNVPASSISKTCLHLPIICSDAEQLVHAAYGHVKRAELDEGHSRLIDLSNQNVEGNVTWVWFFYGCIRTSVSPFLSLYQTCPNLLWPSWSQAAVRDEKHYFSFSYSWPPPRAKRLSACDGMGGNRGAHLEFRIYHATD